MNERIKKLRKVLDLTQQAFADKIGIKQNTIAKYETNRGTPTTAVISLICREFNANETWLRTGEGEMFVKKTRNEELAAFMNDILQGDPDFRQKFISVLSRMTLEEWAILEKKVLELAAEVQAEGRDQKTDRAKTQPETEKVIYPTEWFPTMPMSAGTGQPAGYDEAEELRLIKKPPRGTSFVAPVSGNSMEPTFHDKDKLFIKSCEGIKPGQIGVFYMDGKQWVKELGDGVLISHNPDYPPRPMTDDVRCQGLVLGVCDESYFA